jgi:AraC family transcriptional regulator
MHTTSYPPAPVANARRRLQKAACAADAFSSVTRLLTEAKASLGVDRESACLCLIQAIAVLRQESEFPSSEGESKAGLARWQIKRLTAYINENLGSELRTSHLAATLGLSVSHFSRAFKQTVGISPQAYVVRRRIEAACAMMLATDEPLAEIAYNHGFCDQSHFTRTFQLEIGMAPQAWRRIHMCKWVQNDELQYLNDSEELVQLNKQHNAYA